MNKAILFTLKFVKKKDVSKYTSRGGFTRVVKIWLFDCDDELLLSENNNSA